MQLGTFEAPVPQHDADGVVGRINRLGRAVRGVGGTVVFVQHDGPPGDPFEPGAHGWDLLPDLEREPGGDRLVNKRACDAFYETDLEPVLGEIGARKLLITGSATDYCVDTTVRAAASRDFEVTVVRDGHTTANRPHLDAVTIIEHHNSIWENLILPRATVAVVPAEESVARIAGEPRARAEERPRA